MMTTEIAPNVQTTETTHTTGTVEITDAALITKAKGLNRSIDRYVRKGIEAFWMMGEALGTLYKRRHLQADGKWVSILKEIGVSETTDRNARRFYESCEFADLHLYKNKTEALRKLGIIATPQPTVAAPPKGSNPVEEARSSTAVASSDESDRTDAHPEVSDRSVKSKSTVASEDGSLLVLSQLATRLESLADCGLALDDDLSAQVDRILAAVARLRKGVAVAA